MSIFIDSDTKLVVQGITGRDGSVLLRQSGNMDTVHNYEMHHGDILQLGRTRFIFQTDEGVSS